MGFHMQKMTDWLGKEGLPRTMWFIGHLQEVWIGLLVNWNFTATAQSISIISKCAAVTDSKTA
jgi:hypothetical protein